MSSTSGIIDKRVGKRVLTPKAAAATLLGASLSAAFYAILHYVHDEAIVHPAVLMLLPAIAIVWLALMIPIFMYVAYQDDFKAMNILLPTHYVLIAKRCFKSMRDNDFKVSEKNF